MQLLINLETVLVFEATATTFERWTDRADVAVRSALREWYARAKDLFDQIKQARPAVASPAEQVSSSTAVASEPTASLSGRDIAEVHGTAAIKIDAAEYAYTMMVAELRNVMKSAPYGRQSTQDSGFTMFTPEAVAQAA